RYTIAAAAAMAGLGAMTFEAHAQEAAYFNLPAQPLADSLKAIANQTSTNVLFDLNSVAGINAPSLNAELTPEKAIAELIKGTGFSCELINEHTIVLGKEGDKTGKFRKIANDPHVQAPEGEQGIRLSQSPASGTGLRSAEATPAPSAVEG